MPRSAACAPLPRNRPAVPSPPRLWAVIAPPAPWSVPRAGWAIPRSCCVPTVGTLPDDPHPWGSRTGAALLPGGGLPPAYPLFLPGKSLCLCPGQPPGSALEPPGRALSRGDPPEHRRSLPDSAADPAPGRLTPLPLTQCFLPLSTVPCPSVVSGQGASFFAVDSPDRFCYCIISLQIVVLKEE